MIDVARSRPGTQMGRDASVFVLGSFVVACSAKVPRLPRPGESLRADAFTVEAGGKGLNLAIGAQRLEAKVDGLLAVGDDFFAQFAGPALTRAGLPPHMLRRYVGTTGSGIGFTDADGENCLAVYPGANLLLSARDVQVATEALCQATLVLAQFEIGDEPIVEAFRLAREKNILTLLNPSPYRSLAEEILEQTSILVVNRAEATEIAAEIGLNHASSSADMSDFRRVAETLIEHGPETVIVTIGKDGAYAFQRGGEPLHQPGFEVVAMDSLGAGDAFTAGFAVSLIEGRGLAECLKRGAGCGAMTTQKLGVFDALPTRDELEEFLAAWA